MYDYDVPSEQTEDNYLYQQPMDYVYAGCYGHRHKLYVREEKPSETTSAESNVLSTAQASASASSTTTSRLPTTNSQPSSSAASIASSPASSASIQSSAELKSTQASSISVASTLQAVWGSISASPSPSILIVPGGDDQKPIAFEPGPVVSPTQTSLPTPSPTSITAIEGDANGNFAYGPTPRADGYIGNQERSINKTSGNYSRGGSAVISALVVSVIVILILFCVGLVYLFARVTGRRSRRRQVIADRTMRECANSQIASLVKPECRMTFASRVPMHPLSNVSQSDEEGNPLMSAN